jgi:hypothetical protein
MKLHTFTVSIKAPDNLPAQALERYVREAIVEWRQTFSVGDHLYRLESRNISVRRTSLRPIKEREYDKG